MIEVTSRHMECTLLIRNYSRMPAVALQAQEEEENLNALKKAYCM